MSLDFAEENTDPPAAGVVAGVVAPVEDVVLVLLLLVPGVAAVVLVAVDVVLFNVVLPASALAVVCAGEEGATVGEADVPRSSPAMLPIMPPNEPKLEKGDGAGAGREAVADAVKDGRGAAGAEIVGTVCPDTGAVVVVLPIVGFVGDSGGAGFAGPDESLLAAAAVAISGGGAVPLRGEVVGVGAVPVNVATPVPFSRGVNEGEGGPAVSPKISLMMDTMSSSSSSAAVGLRAPLASGLPRAHSRAVAMRRDVSRPICRPSLSVSGSARAQRNMYEGMRSLRSSSYCWYSSIFCTGGMTNFSNSRVQSFLISAKRQSNASLRMATQSSIVASYIEYLLEEMNAWTMSY